MKFIKRSKEKVFPESVVEAHLIGLGSGTLEFIDDTMKFHIEKGRFRKRQEVSREIPLSDIKAINRVGNELSITWKGSTDIFVIEKAEQVGTVLEKLPKTSEEQKELFEHKKVVKQQINEVSKIASTDKELADSFVIEKAEQVGTVLEKLPKTSDEQKELFEHKKVVKQQINEVSKIVSTAMELADSLFDIIRSLHGWIDWNRIENLLKKSNKKAEELTDQKNKLLELDFSKLTLAIKDQTHEEISKETFNLLRLLYDYFIGKESENETLTEIHPNYFDAKAIVQAHYLLNDIVLGSIIGDEEIGEEQKE
ncbi:MAG: hypothetical protein FK732_10405, partial [Asgard group archaeon]|nr:hypothetical protein [Asgard group archaeon]